MDFPRIDLPLKRQIYLKSPVRAVHARPGIIKKQVPIRLDGDLFLAEKEGFEPSIPFWGIHDFQSCALGQLRDFSIRGALLPARLSYNMKFHLSSVSFSFFQKISVM